ncbi:MAG: antibiotic biosynthesis monooxygenase [Planctomycetes bacterium]|nr:antibiotic biosynthesis monooxygenase [Planctomycetota bacterium]
MIHVVATLTVKPGTRSEFLGEFQRMVPQTLAEDGCLGYEPLIDCPAGVHTRQISERAEVVTVVERWRDLAALQAHLVAPHMAAYRERVKHLVVSGSLQILRVPEPGADSAQRG